MLTPKELSRVQFDRVFRGYSPEAVDEFLARLIAEYETVCKERDQLQAQLAESAAERARAADTSPFDRLLDAARESADHLTAAAREEAVATKAQARAAAEALVVEARTQAAQLLRAAQGRIDDLERERSQLVFEEARLKSGAGQLLAACQEFLDGHEAMVRPAEPEAAAAEDEADPDRD